MSLAHLRDLWHASVEEVKTNSEADKPSFARLGLQDSDDVVFEVKAAIKAQAEILERHQITEDSHISKPDPKYK